MARDTGVVTDLRTSRPTQPPDGAFEWVELDDRQTLPDELHELGLPPLVVEDVVSGGQRPKLEHYDDGSFLVADAAAYDDPSESISYLQLRVFWTDSRIVTVSPTSLGTARRLHRAYTRGHWRPRHPVEVIHALLDRIVDGYVPVVDEISNDVVEVEQIVFDETTVQPSQRIYLLKRQVLAFQRHSAPLLPAVGELRRIAEHLDSRLGEHEQMEVDDRLRDVDDHLRDVVQRSANLSELISDALDANLAQISVRQNEDMRKMSAWAAIFLLPTLLAGMWGMNFDHMPETDWRFGYPLALVLMVAASAGLYLRFRRSGWL